MVLVAALLLIATLLSSKYVRRAVPTESLLAVSLVLVTAFALFKLGQL